MQGRGVPGRLLEAGEDKMILRATFNDQDILKALCADRDAAMKIIKDIDLSIADWDFTEQLVIDLIDSMKSDVNDVDPLVKAIDLIKGCNP